MTVASVLCLPAAHAPVTSISRGEGEGWRYYHIYRGKHFMTDVQILLFANQLFYVALFAFYQLNGEVTVTLFIYWVYIRYDFWGFSFTSDFTKTLAISLQMYIFSFCKKIYIVK